MDAQQINFSALKNRDENAVAIMDCAKLVSAYNYDQKSTSWVKLDVEGSLFLYKRSNIPHFRFVILNKNGLNDIFVDIAHTTQFHNQLNFLLYKNFDGTIRGVWFFDIKECERILNQLNEIKDVLRTQSFQAAAPNIITMLEHATKSQNPNKVITTVSAFDIVDKGSTTATSSSKPITTHIVKPTPRKTPQKPATKPDSASQPAQTTGPISVNQLFDKAQQLQSEQSNRLLVGLNQAQTKEATDNQRQTVAGLARPMKSVFRSISQHDSTSLTHGARGSETPSSTLDSTRAAQELMNILNIDSDNKAMPTAPAAVSAPVGKLSPAPLDRVPSVPRLKQVESPTKFPRGQLTDQASKSFFSVSPHSEAAPNLRELYAESLKDQRDATVVTSSAGDANSVAVSEFHSHGHNRPILPVPTETGSNEITTQALFLPSGNNQPKAEPIVSSASVLPRYKQTIPNGLSDLKSATIGPIEAFDSNLLAPNEFFDDRSTHFRQNAPPAARPDPVSFSSGFDLSPLEGQLSSFDAYSSSIDKPVDTKMNGDLSNLNVASGSQPAPLTKENLKEALMYLLQNDTDFVSTLHQAYLKIAKSNEFQQL